MIMIIVCSAMNVLDLLTGIVCAIKNKNIVSAKLRDGLFKKFGFVIIYGLAYIIDEYGVLYGINLPISVLAMSCTYIFFTEAVSIYENAKKLNGKIDGLDIEGTIRKGEKK